MRHTLVVLCCWTVNACHFSSPRPRPIDDGLAQDAGKDSPIEADPTFSQSTS
jgi:hypothetical protein